MMAVDHGANGVAEIAQEVPAIRHLDCIGGTLADAVCIRARTVTGDDLDPGVLTQPHCECLGLAVWQEFHDRVAFEIDEDGAVAVPSPPRPVVHPKNLWDRRRRLGDYRLGGHPQQRVGADWDGEPFGQSRGGFAAKREGDVTLENAEPGRSTRRHWCNRTQLFGKGLPGTCWIEASETPCGDPDGGRASLPRQIAQHARVMAVQAS